MSIDPSLRGIAALPGIIEEMQRIFSKDQLWPIQTASNRWTLGTYRVDVVDLSDHFRVVWYSLETQIAAILWPSDDASLLRLANIMMTFLIAFEKEATRNRLP